MTSYPEIWNALAEEFRAELVRSRPAGGNRSVRYITARTAMNRLDQVLGFENWWDAYERDPGGSDNILCRLTIRLPDGSTVTKCDVGAPGNTGDEGEDDKGAVSDAFKRAAVKFGVGRYLYGEGVYRCPRPEPTPRAALPAPADVPEVVPPPPPAPTVDPGPPPKGERQKWGGPRPEATTPPSARKDNVPASGRKFFAWCKDQEERYGVGLVKYLNGWAKLQEFSGRMVDWDADQVGQAHAEAVRKLQTIQVGPAEAYEEAMS